VLILNELLSKAPLGSPAGQVEDDGVKPPLQRQRRKRVGAVGKNGSPPKDRFGLQEGLAND